MGKILYVVTHGTDDPTRASIGFNMARGAKEAGHEAGIALLMDATVLIKDLIRETMVGVGLSPLKELFTTAVQNKVPIYV